MATRMYLPGHEVVCGCSSAQELFKWYFLKCAKRRKDEMSKKTLWIGLTNNFNWFDENDTAYICSITLRSLVIHLLMANWELNDSQSTTSDRMSASFPSFSVFVLLFDDNCVCVCERVSHSNSLNDIFVHFYNSLCMTWEKQKNWEKYTNNDHFNVTVQLIYNK